MKIVRVFLPYGAHLRFDGVPEVHTFTDYVKFTYQAKDAKTDNPKKGLATATFNRHVICGISEEEE